MQNGLTRGSVDASKTDSQGGRRSETDIFDPYSIGVAVNI